jgi:rod shape-determining protein MreD
LFRRIVPFLLVFLAMLLDTSVLPFLVTSAYLPMLSLMSVACIGLLLGRTRGTLYGMIAGLMIDITVSTPLGVMTLLYAATGFVCGVAGRKFQRYVITTVVAPLVCFLGYEAFMVVYSAAAGLEITGMLIRQAVTRAAIETALAQLMYLAYDKMIQPVWSRYAAK